MPNEPEIGSGIEVDQVNDEVHAYGVKETIFDQCSRKTSVVTAPMVGITIAHLSKDPRKVDPCTAAREEEIVVVFILPRGGTLESCALD
jgi:hypothetical protein